MLSHVTLGITAMDRAMAFYGPMMAALGWVPKFADATWAGWKMPEADRPLFIITRPFDGRAAQPGNGAMVALMADTRACVDTAYALALRHGGQDEGGPGLRPHYHPDYYGAYVRDPDGNKLGLCCHAPV